MDSLGTQKLLFNQYTAIKKNPIHGFDVELIDENNLYEWNVFIEGPEGTEYEGGIFKAVMKFPKDYPYNPPSLQFISQFWHPNVYTDGKVCVSILHPPGHDPLNDQERPEERWSPVQTPESILLSVLLLLSEPNISSPANVDASLEYRKKRPLFKRRISKLIELAKKDLPKNYVMPYKLVKNVQKHTVKDVESYYNDSFGFGDDEGFVSGSESESDGDDGIDSAAGDDDDVDDDVDDEVEGEKTESEKTESTKQQESN